MPCELAQLLDQIRACTECQAHLPLGPRPVLRAHGDAPILLIGQAPGTRVHHSGVPWDDPSGVRLRQWLAVSDECFYDPHRFAIVPMGFCYPGKGKSGDLPPRPECAPKWHPKILPHLKQRQLTLLVGQYAQRHYLQDGHKTLTERVRHYEQFPSGVFALPHPSPRNTLWLKRNPWFEDEVVPRLRAAVSTALRGQLD